MKRIYLDHGATTPPDPIVREAMASTLNGPFGNPSSQHWAGRESVRLLDQARDTVASALNAQAAEVCFTSSGTEAANLAVLGCALRHRNGRIVFSPTEHHCVIKAAKLAAELGSPVDTLPVDAGGRVDPDDVRNALAQPAALLCLMHANNETGAIQPVDQIAFICAERDTQFFCDAVQTFGLMPLPNAHLLSVSAHKIYGPKGVGALRVRPGVRLQPVMLGGGQERERRAGTENLLGIAGMAAAVRAFHPDRYAHLAKLRDRFESIVLAELPGVRVSSADGPRHPGISHLIVDGVAAESVLIRLDQAGIAASSGAACSSGAIEPSHVLLAMGFPPELATSGLRFSFGTGNTIDEVEHAAAILVECVRAIRG